MQPALLAVGAQDEPVGAVLLEELDLVALVEVADLRAAQLVGRVEQADDAVADDLPLAAVERADEAVIERQPRCGLGVADRVGLAGLEERRPPPAWHERFGVLHAEHGARRGRDAVDGAHGDARSPA